MNRTGIKMTELENRLEQNRIERNITLIRTQIGTKIETKVVIKYEIWDNIQLYN